MLASMGVTIWTRKPWPRVLYVSIEFGQIDNGNNVPGDVASGHRASVATHEALNRDFRRSVGSMQFAEFLLDLQLQLGFGVSATFLTPFRLLVSQLALQFFDYPLDPWKSTHVSP